MVPVGWEGTYGYRWNEKLASRSIKPLRDPAQEMAVLPWSVECSLCCWGGLVHCRLILLEIHTCSVKGMCKEDRLLFL